MEEIKIDWYVFAFLQLKKIRSLVIAGALEYDNFVSLLRLQEGAFKLSVSQNFLLSCWGSDYKFKLVYCRRGYFLVPTL